MFHRRSLQRKRTKYPRILCTLAIALPIVVCAAPAHPDVRIALVIGNGHYAGAPPLPNPLNDAKLITQSLRTIGFTVTETQDLGLVAMKQEIVKFGRTAKDADVALLYYAGHGMQINGINYLIPVDARLSEETAVKFETVELDDVSEAVAGAKTRVIILDACRDNPFSPKMIPSSATRGINRGLARFEATAPGELIVFSTDPNKIAEDGQGTDSTFAAAVAAYLRQPGLEIHQVFTRVRVAVATATDKRQVPWENSSLLGDVFLNGPTDGITRTQSAELAMWQAAQSANTAVGYEAYKKRYPNGEFAEMADIELDALAHPRPANPPSEPAPRFGMPPISNEPKIHSANVTMNSVSIVVMNRPPGAPSILINGKNVGSMLESEKQYGSATSYTFKGSPEQLNLHVGDNNLSVKYGDDALPGFPFQFTSMQKEQSEAVQTRSAMHQQIMKEMNRTRVSSVNITSDSVSFVVLHPPTGASRITLNGKDISSLVQSESRTEAGAFSTVAYSVRGAPKDLNLRVGANVANISYATKESVDFDFTCTETQYHQAELRHRTQYNSR